MGFTTEDYTLEIATEAMKVYESLETIDIEMKMDLDNALTSTLLTAEHRKVLFAVNNLEFNFMQSAKLLGYGVLEVQELLVEATEIITAVMNGYRSEHHKGYDNVVPTTLQDFLIALDFNVVSPLSELTSALQHDLLNYLVEQENDRLAKEVLRQQEEGTPQHVIDELFSAEYSEELYNCYKVSDRIEKGQQENRKDTDAFAKQARDNKVVYITDDTEHFISQQRIKTY